MSNIPIDHEDANKVLLDDNNPQESAQYSHMEGLRERSWVDASEMMSIS